MKINYTKVLKEIAAKECYNRRHSRKKFIKYVKLWFDKFEQSGMKINKK